MELIIFPRIEVANRRRRGKEEEYRAPLAAHAVFIVTERSEVTLGKSGCVRRLRPTVTILQGAPCGVLPQRRWERCIMLILSASAFKRCQPVSRHTCAPTKPAKLGFGA